MNIVFVPSSSSSTVPLPEIGHEEFPQSEKKKHCTEETKELRGTAILMQLQGNLSPFGKRYLEQINVPYAYRINSLINDVAEFESRFLHPKPPNAHNRIYKELLEEGLWEYDAIFDCLTEELEDFSTFIEKESPVIAPFVCENIEKIASGMNQLYQAYEPVHTVLLGCVGQLFKRLHKLKGKIAHQFYEFCPERVENIRQTLWSSSHAFSENENLLANARKRLNRDLKQIQNQLLWVGDAMTVPFSLKNQMEFSYLEGDGRYCLNPPSDNYLTAKNDYDNLRIFFMKYQGNVLEPHFYHYQGLLGRVIEMINLCKKFSRLLESLECDIVTFSKEIDAFKPL